MLICEFVPGQALMGINRNATHTRKAATSRSSIAHWNQATTSIIIDKNWSLD